MKITKPNWDNVNITTPSNWEQINLLLEKKGLSRRTITTKELKQLVNDNFDFIFNI